MKTEVWFKGTLADCYDLVKGRVLSPGLFGSGPWPLSLFAYSRTPDELEKETSFLLEIASNKEEYDEHLSCWVKAERIPNGCLVTAVVDDKHIECVKLWTTLHYEMVRRGWIEMRPNSRKGIFRLRTKYFVVGIVLGIAIVVVSLALFPDWARSNLLLAILFPIAFAGATSFIANFRKAYE